ncbi:zinc finger protein 320-like [Melanaphis sacchari]|uniref:zinc finger protein 320-like n=1 Tax=Melanaphis sacchari TaxID=742174 RepID=UPI000DC151AC|nr:zinc finger protein 320-like [Melanaphis sacchari]
MAEDPPVTIDDVSTADTEASNSSDNEAEDNPDDPVSVDTSDDDLASIQSIDSGEDNVALKYHCNKCDKKFKFNCWFKRHMATHNPALFVCEYCPKVYKRKDILREHQYSHFGGPKYKCKNCKKVFGDKRNLNAHTKLVHKDSQIPM